MQNNLPKLAAPALRALAGAKVSKLTDLSKFTENEIAALHGMGPNAMGKLRTEMKKQKVAFKK